MQTVFKDLMRDGKSQMKQLGSRAAAAHSAAIVRDHLEKSGGACGGAEVDVYMLYFAPCGSLAFYS